MPLDVTRFCSQQSDLGISFWGLKLIYSHSLPALLFSPPFDYSGFGRFLVSILYSTAVPMLPSCWRPMPFGQLVQVLLLPLPGFSFDQCLLPFLLLILLEVVCCLHHLPSSFPLLCTPRNSSVSTDNRAQESFPAHSQRGQHGQTNKRGHVSKQTGTNCLL